MVVTTEKNGFPTVLSTDRQMDRDRDREKETETESDTDTSWGGGSQKISLKVGKNISEAATSSGRRRQGRRRQGRRRQGRRRHGSGDVTVT